MSLMSGREVTPGDRQREREGERGGGLLLKTRTQDQRAFLEWVGRVGIKFRSGMFV